MTNSAEPPQKKKLSPFSKILKGFMFLLLLFGLFRTFFPALPDCDEPKVLELTQQLILQHPALNKTQSTIDKVLFSAEISYDDQAFKRVCAAKAYIKKKGERPATQLEFQYELSWEERMDKMYIVRLML